ncbi:hypothetical protein [Haloprofundus salilacus]|uniref:hypothetical protein n=1 Tax=Haloprofundus salilacus TaxID=2876190 RepID=UPI001CC9D245|nr:hypothetical protein [Haloprofundus salilacus]
MTDSDGCQRCGVTTSSRTLAGEPLCEKCQKKRRDEQTSRSVHQENLNSYE